jgi:hypothetical protein
MIQRCLNHSLYLPLILPGSLKMNKSLKILTYTIFLFKMNYMEKTNIYKQELIKGKTNTISIANLLKKVTVKKRLKRILKKDTINFEKFMAIYI